MHLPSRLKGNSLLANVEPGWSSVSPRAVKYSGDKPKPKKKQEIERTLFSIGLLWKNNEGKLLHLVANRPHNDVRYCVCENDVV